MSWLWECWREHLSKWLINIISERDKTTRPFASLFNRNSCRNRQIFHYSIIARCWNGIKMDESKGEKILLVWITSVVIQVTATSPPPRGNFCSQFNFQEEEKRNKFLTSVQVIFLFPWGFVFIHTSHLKVLTATCYSSRNWSENFEAGTVNLKKP